MANEMLLNISQDPNERARFRSRRIWLQDREHEQAVWKEEGRQEADAEYETLLANKDVVIANKDAEIRALLAQLEAREKFER